MVAYNFKARFAPLVASGAKTQTIRPPRSAKSPHAHPGDVLQLYTGLRTKAAKKIVNPDPQCVLSKSVIIHRDSLFLPGMPQPIPDMFAKADGFEDFGELVAFIDNVHGLPFHGRLIVWDHPDAIWSYRGRGELIGKRKIPFGKAAA